MKKFRIYVDTSVLGGCFDPEFSAWSNALIEDFRRGRFRPVLAEVTVAEVEGAPQALNAVNTEQGYRTLAIHSPREVATHERDEDDPSR